MVEKVEKPWGYEKIWAQTDEYVGKILVIDGGHRLSRQYHELKDETIYVLDGALCLEIGEGESIEKHVLTVGDSYHVSPGTVHRFCAEHTACTIVEVSTPELNDVVRLEDDYNRD